jgi:hypothetical protein
VKHEVAQQIADASGILVAEAELQVVSSTGQIANLIKYTNGKFGPLSFGAGRSSGKPSASGFTDESTSIRNGVAIGPHHAATDL